MPGYDFAHTLDESESMHFAHARRYIFARQCQYGR